MESIDGGQVVGRDGHGLPNGAVLMFLAALMFDLVSGTRGEIIRSAPPLLHTNAVPTG